MHPPKATKQENNASAWDEAIRDAERKLTHTQTRSKRLLAAIDFFKASRERGDHFPVQRPTVTQ
jgi:hypothetical protein